MRKVWALVDVGDVIVGQPFENEEHAHSAHESLSYFGDMVEVRQINFNDEPLDEEGEALKEQFLELMKDTTHFHMSKGVKFYEMSLKERYRMLINTLTAPREAYEPFDLDDSDMEKVDVKDWVSKL